MGKPKYIYFREEVLELMESIPKGELSRIINDLLFDYIRKQDVTSMTEEELKKAIELAKLEEEFKKRRESIQNGN